MTSTEAEEYAKKHWKAVTLCGEDPLNAEGDEFLTDYCPNCGAKMDEEVEGRKKDE